MAEQARDDPILEVLRDLDARIDGKDLEIWVGAEPTFTDRFSFAAEWLSQALGDEKEVRARRLAAALVSGHPGGALLRTLGRQYPGESSRRWSYGVLRRRDGAGLWGGPPDPLVGGAPTDAAALERFAAAVASRLAGHGWYGYRFSVDDSGEQRILLTMGGEGALPSPERDDRLHRPSIHAPRTGPLSPNDSLADEGLYLLILDLAEEDGARFAALELPGLADPHRFLAVLDLVEQGAKQVGLAGLILRGYPPPADELLHWSTITPDPGVVEVNQAPTAVLSELLRENRVLFAAAAKEGLTPYRLHYNGQADDSGGGGQISIGGPTPGRSPFVVAPHLLPALVRYFNHHPCLSYWFAPHYVGAFSQAPRPDEGVVDLFHELEVTLEYLATQPSPSPELLWRSLNPFLRDVSGNAHRSEINVEKLWSPVPRPDRIAGVVELRAFRMARTPEAMAALAGLVRTLTAMLMVQSFDQPLVYWGNQLHDRFALPFFIEQDLDNVLEDLSDTGFGLPQELADLLRSEFSRTIAEMHCQEHTLTLSSALEFWPQVGDTMSQPTDSRLVDATTARLEIRIDGGRAERLDDWQLAVNGYSIPMRLEPGSNGPVRVIGIRYRRYNASHALHPGIEPKLPIRIQLYNSRSGRLVKARFHEWRPDGGAYPGLPEGLEAAAERRRERLVCRQTLSTSPPPTRAPSPYALTEHCFDLRRA